MPVPKTLTPALRKILEALGDHSEIICETPSRTYWIRKKGPPQNMPMTPVKRAAVEKLLALGAIKLIGCVQSRETYATVPAITSA
jgi:hypothetical protein